MTAQLAFRFDRIAPVRRTDPDTSRAAARSVAVAELEAQVLEALRVLGPSTSHRVAEHLRRELVAVSPRFRPLVNKGLVRDGGQRGLTPSGCKATLWELVR